MDFGKRQFPYLLLLVPSGTSPSKPSSSFNLPHNSLAVTMSKARSIHHTRSKTAPRQAGLYQDIIAAAVGYLSKQQILEMSESMRAKGDW